MFITLRFFLADLRSLLRNEENPYMGMLGGGRQRKDAGLRLLMQVGISLIILVFAIKVIADPAASEKAREIAAGFLGTVIGYWLR